MFLGKRRSQSKRSESPQRVNRSLFLGGLLAFWMLGLVGRLYDLQVVQYADLLGRAQKQQQRAIEVAPQRGTILDRQMHPLAMSLATDSVYAVPAEIPNREIAAQLLAPILGLGTRELLERFQSSRSFCWLKRKASTQEADRVRGLNLKGINFQKEMKRYFPKGELGSHVLGYVGMDDKGLAGVEFGLDSVIRGRPGRVLVAEDARRQSFRSSEWPGQPGKDVVLTIDEYIQYNVERALGDAVEHWRAAGGTVIVQDPATGEILALANQPTFDPNDFSKSRPRAWLNRAIAWNYEPGSTFKLVTLSAALEEGLTNPQEVIDCQMGSIVLAGHTIHDHKPFGDLTVEGILANSSDVGAIKLGLRLGEARLDRYIRNFGFGARTGIELPGEERGLVNPPRRWSGISIGEISMGQEVGVTPLQLVSAYSVVANGGVLVPARIVRDVSGGAAREALRPAMQGEAREPADARRVLSERTAEEMKRMLTEVVERGTGSAARLDAYTAAGKTGTAQKIDASRHYSKRHYISSFVGFAPTQKPAVTILVVIDSPVGAIYGAEVAAPVFRTIAEQTLGYLNVPQDNPSRWLQVSSAAPAGSSRQTRGGRVGALTSGSELSEVATSPVNPVPNISAQGARGRSTHNDGLLTTVPDFSGLAVRRVAEACQELGLDLALNGSGLASRQVPAAGTRVPLGTRIWVSFSR